MQIKDDALERVLRLDFYHQQESDLLMTQAFPLVQEHLRLVWHWSNYLDVSSRWTNLIYSGLAQWLIAGIKLDKTTEQILSVRKYPTLWVRQTLKNYLLWSAVEEIPKVKDCNFASPYEPLISLYE